MSQPTLGKLDSKYVNSWSREIENQLVYLVANFIGREGELLVRYHYLTLLGRSGVHVL